MGAAIDELEWSQLWFQLFDDDEDVAPLLPDISREKGSIDLGVIFELEVHCTYTGYVDVTGPLVVMREW